MLAVHASRARTCPSGRNRSRGAVVCGPKTAPTFETERWRRTCVARSGEARSVDGYRKPSRRKESTIEANIEALTVRGVVRRGGSTSRTAVVARIRGATSASGPSRRPPSWPDLASTPSRGRARARQRPRRKALRGRRLRKLGRGRAELHRRRDGSRWGARNGFVTNLVDDSAPAAIRTSAVTSTSAPGSLRCRMTVGFPGPLKCLAIRRAASSSTSATSSVDSFGSAWNFGSSSPATW